MSPHEVSFEAMGTSIRLIVDDAIDPQAPSPAVAAEASRRWIEEFDARMSRFRADSELCSLNADPSEQVYASPLLRATIAAGLWAAQRSGGLVDPTLLDDLERVGYDHSLAHVTPAPLREGLEDAPPRRPARPNPHARWRLVTIDDADGTIHRPAGIRLDTGGSGKGLCADAVAHRLSDYSRVVVDCGGDVRVGGPGSRTEPFEIEIEHPLTGATAHSFALGDGAIATSGINARIWQCPDGSYAHHVLDPSIGAPAWTGLIQVTAIARTALEAETVAKTALLSGAARARELLAASGGALIHDDGALELIGSLRFEEAAA